jgi:endonuclease III
MKGASEYAKRLKRYLASLRRMKRRSDAGEPDPRETDIVEEMVLAILEEETDRASARAALASVMEWMVDFNELRVTPPRELVRVMSRPVPEAKEKAQRITQVLNHIFDKNNSLRMNSLRDRPIREVRQFLNTLEGMTPFATACVIRRCLGGHAIPLDEVLRTFLIDRGLAPPDADPAELQGFLERHILAADSSLFLTAARAQALSHHRRILARQKREAGTAARAGQASSGTRSRASGKSGKASSAPAASARKPRRSGARAH